MSKIPLKILKVCVNEFEKSRGLIGMRPLRNDECIIFIYTMPVGGISYSASSVSYPFTWATFNAESQLSKCAILDKTGMCGATTPKGTVVVLEAHESLYGEIARKDVKLTQDGIIVTLEVS
jgi:hypothetical protein